jgi:hypothetical protein
MKWAGHVARKGGGDVHTGFWWGALRKRYHLENLGVDGKIILKRIFNTCERGMDWNDLTQSRDRWQALVNAVMNHRVP